MGAKDTLGILVQTDKHFDYVVKLADAASEKGKQVRIYLMGAGVRLIEINSFGRLCSLLRVEICSESLPATSLARPVNDRKCRQTESFRMCSEFLQDCDRCVVF